MTFIPNPGFEAEVKRSPEVAGLLRMNAEEVKAVGQALAPYQTADDREPHIRDSFEVRDGPEPGEIEVANTSPHWLFVEYGTEDTPPQPSLGPALDAVVGRE